MRRSFVGLEQVVEAENLSLAFHATRKGKALDSSLLAFELDLENNLALIRKEVLNNGYTFGPYHPFMILDPKPRMIHAAPVRDRVLHHAIIQATESTFESFQIYESYACRKGKGTHKAVLRAFHYAKSHSWYLKLDIRKYYDSIDHRIMYDRLQRSFKNPGFLFLMFGLLDSYQTNLGKGLPIGNLTSQYWANHYLAVFDHYIKETLRQKAYIRYMDDMVIFSGDKIGLIQLRDQIREFLGTNLSLSLKLAEIGACQRGLPFLGFTIKPTGIFLAKRSRDRFRRKLGHLKGDIAAGRVNMATAQARATALVAFTIIARARRFRKSVLRSILG